jgi:asparagine N-glycosylation enzyme membrane subunit Stt3
VFMPVWFGTLATVLLGFLAWECSGSALAAGFAALVMSIIPAHLMRSVGGGFDNESLGIKRSCLFLVFFSLCTSKTSYFLHGCHVSVLGSQCAHSRVVVVWPARGRGAARHGGRLGRIRLCRQHGRTARRIAHCPRQIQLG